MHSLRDDTVSSPAPTSQSLRAFESNSGMACSTPSSSTKILLAIPGGRKPTKYAFTSRLSDLSEPHLGVSVFLGTRTSDEMPVICTAIEKEVYIDIAGHQSFNALQRDLAVIEQRTSSRRPSERANPLQAVTYTLRTTTPPFGGIAPSAVARIFVQLATAIASLHALGIVHGNLNPDTVGVNPDGSACLSGYATGSLLPARGLAYALAAGLGVGSRIDMSWPTSEGRVSHISTSSSSSARKDISPRSLDISSPRIRAASFATEMRFKTPSPAPSAGTNGQTVPRPTVSYETASAHLASLLASSQASSSPSLVIARLASSLRARSSPSSSPATHSLAWQFTAPEILVDARTNGLAGDTWSLAAVLVFMACGAAPFASTTVREHLVAAASMHFAPAAQRWLESLPATHRAVVVGLLQPSPDCRLPLERLPETEFWQMMEAETIQMQAEAAQHAASLLLNDNHGLCSNEGVIMVHGEAFPLSELLGGSRSPFSPWHDSSAHSLLSNGRIGHRESADSMEPASFSAVMGASPTSSHLPSAHSTQSSRDSGDRGVLPIISKSVSAAAMAAAEAALALVGEGSSLSAAARHTIYDAAMRAATSVIFEQPKTVATTSAPMTVPGRGVGQGVVAGGGGRDEDSGSGTAAANTHTTTGTADEESDMDLATPRNAQISCCSVNVPPIHLGRSLYPPRAGAAGAAGAGAGGVGVPSIHCSATSQSNSAQGYIPVDHRCDSSRRRAASEISRAASLLLEPHFSPRHFDPVSTETPSGATTSRSGCSQLMLPPVIAHSPSSTTSSATISPSSRPIGVAIAPNSSRQTPATGDAARYLSMCDRNSVSQAAFLENTQFLSVDMPLVTPRHIASPRTVSAANSRAPSLGGLDTELSDQAASSTSSLVRATPRAPPPRWGGPSPPPPRIDALEEALATLVPMAAPVILPDSDTTPSPAMSV